MSKAVSEREWNGKICGDSVKDIVFVFPPASHEDNFDYHLGAGYIASFIQQHGVKTHQLITHEKMTIPDISARILQYKPEIVGFTCYDSNYAYVRMLAKILKRRDPDLRVITGGPSATFSDKEIMAHTPEIDVCVRGEGEKTTLELIQKGLEDLESIEGITYRSGSTVVSTQNRPLISGGVKGAELDVLPSPFLTGTIPPDGKTGVLTSRGCVYRCTYCNFTTMFNHTIRYHSIDRVIEELTLIADHWDPVTLDRVTIYDDIFSLDVKRTKKLCQRIIDEEIDLSFYLATRADSCDKELLELMKEAGVQEISFGLESASRKVLRAIKKAPNHKEKQFLAQIRKCVQWAKEAGMSPGVSIIMGLPEEGPEEAEETLRFVEELQVDHYVHNILILCPGTELFSTRKEYGLDAYHSPAFLPYVTQYAYDTVKIAPLPHANLTKGLESRRRTYCNLLSYEIDKDLDAYEYLIIKKMPEDEGFSQWLQTLCVLPLTVVDFTKGTKEEKVHHYESLLQGEVPVGHYYIVLEDEPHLVNLSTNVDLRTPVSETPFHQYRQYEEGLNALMTVEQLEDVEALSQFANDYTKEGIVSVPVRKVPQWLAGTCRWREELCPALSGNILVVNGDDVLPCYYGEPIGRVGDSKKTLRENARKLLYQKETERGCHDCLLEKCSHCLYPPVTDTEFCEMKKKYPHVSKLVTVADWLHHFPEYKDETAVFPIGNSMPLFYRGERGKGEPLPQVRDNVRILSLGENAVVVITEESKFFSLDLTMAAILEAFLLGVSRESLITYLCETEGDRENAVSTLSSATIFLRKMGLLNPEGEGSNQ